MIKVIPKGIQQLDEEQQALPKLKDSVEKGLKDTGN